MITLRTSHESGVLSLQFSVNYGAPVALIRRLIAFCIRAVQLAWGWVGSVVQHNYPRFLRAVKRLSRDLAIIVGLITVIGALVEGIGTLAAGLLALLSIIGG